MRKICSFLLFGALLTACSGNPDSAAADAKKKEEPKRIVSLSGTITEVIYALNAEKELVAIDVTSTYPSATAKLTNLGHVRAVTAETILGVKPTHVLAFEDELNPQLRKQLEQAKVEVLTFNREYTVKSTKKVISEIAGWLGQKEAAAKLNARIDADLKGIQKLAVTPKVLFVYARGVGNLMVAGEETQLQTIIELAGGKNAAAGFVDFKPLTSEAVVAANPDAILMFESGVSSLSSDGGVLAVPGVSVTTAGKRKAVIAMDGQLLSGFGPRVGQAIADLNKALSRLK